MLGGIALCVILRLPLIVHQVKELLANGGSSGDSTSSGLKFTAVVHEKLCNDFQLSNSLRKAHNTDLKNAYHEQPTAKDDENRLIFLLKKHEHTFSLI